MLLWSAIDKFANKNYLGIRVTKDAVLIPIIHFPQQATQHFRMTVDIANDVVFTGDHKLPLFLAGLNEASEIMP